MSGYRIQWEMEGNAAPPRRVEGGIHIRSRRAGREIPVGRGKRENDRT